MGKQRSVPDLEYSVVKAFQVVRAGRFTPSLERYVKANKEYLEVREMFCLDSERYEQCLDGQTKHLCRNEHFSYPYSLKIELFSAYLFCFSVKQCQREGSVRPNPFHLRTNTLYQDRDIIHTREKQTTPEYHYQSPPVHTICMPIY